MVKRSTTIRTEEDLPANGKPDPIVVAVREYLTAGGFPPEGLEGYEFSIRAQQLNRQGKALHGVAFDADTFDALPEKILDEVGPGRYTLYCTFKPAGTDDKKKFFKVQDIHIVDPDDPANLGEIPPGRDGEDAPRRSAGGVPDLFSVMMANQNAIQAMMMKSQEQQTQIIVALIGKSNGHGGGSSEILDAVRLGTEVAGQRSLPAHEETDTDPDESPAEKLIRFALKAIDIFKTMPADGTVDAAALRNAGADVAEQAAKDLTAQGFEVH